MKTFSKKFLEEWYLKRRLSSAEIATFYKCSEHKVNYWIGKYKIKKRSISEAIYVRCNPNGDPFTIRKPDTVQDAILFGLGVGLYWGEGNKKNLHSIRLGNTDPQLIKKFLEFLQKIYLIDPKKLRFGLQIFGDMSLEKTMRFWKKELGVPPNQFFKTTITPTRGVGTYREKTKYGVLTIHFSNKKLRDHLCGEIENL